MKPNMYEIWQYIYSLLPDDIPSDINECLYINVVMVNPKTLEIDDDKSLNTQVRIWLEFGLYVVIDCSIGNVGNTVYEILPGVSIPSYIHTGIKKKQYWCTTCHDIDVEGNTFEEAFTELYTILKEKYGVINSKEE